MKLTIGKKLWASTLLLLALVVIMGVTAYQRVQGINHSLGVVLDSEMVQSQASSNMEIQVNRIGLGLLGYMLAADTEALDRIKTGITAFEDARKQYYDLCTTENGRQLGIKVKGDLEKIASLTDELVKGKNRQSEVLQSLLADAEKITALIKSKIQSGLKTDDLQHQAKMNSSMEMEISISGIINSLNGFLNTHDSTYLERIQNEKDNFLRFLKLYQGLSLNGYEQDGSQEMGSLFKANMDRIDEIVIIEQKNMEDLNTFIALRRAVQSILNDEIQALTAKDLKAAQDKSVSITRTTVVIIVVITVIGLLFGGFTSYFITRSISVPLEKLSKWADRIAARDFDDMEIETGNDEIGHLNECFKQMVKDLRDFSEQTTGAVQNINTVSAEILAAIQQQASSMKEQAAALQETSSTMEEIRETGSQVSEKAKIVAQSAEATSTASEAGLRAVEETHNIMESIRLQVEQVAQNIVTLSEKTQAIGDIIATVNDIAEQSNLLALNAAIEAVGAGEQGQRFSVVANEIKNLADQAKESTLEVRGILGEIQGGISSSVMSTEEAVKRVGAGRAKSEISAETIRQLTTTMTASIQAFQQIVAGTGQQQIGIDQVNRALIDIQQATQQTSSGVGQIESAVANLNELSGQLKETVEKA